MPQKSSKNLSTLSNHVPGKTKLQLTQNKINGELYFDTTYSYLYIYYTGWIHVL